MLTGDIFTGKTNFFFIPPMQGERAEFAFIEIHLRKTARSLFSFPILRAVLVRDFGWLPNFRTAQ